MPPHAFLKIYAQKKICPKNLYSLVGLASIFF